MSAHEQPSTYVDPTDHRPGDFCEHCDDLQSCPGYLGNRTTQRYRVEGWEYGAWAMLSGPQEHVGAARKRMAQLKDRFPQTPMRIVAETTTYTVVGAAPGNAAPSEGAGMT